MAQSPRAAASRQFPRGRAAFSAPQLWRVGKDTAPDSNPNSCSLQRITLSDFQISLTALSGM